MRAKKVRPSKMRKTSPGVERTTAEAWEPWLTIVPPFKGESDAPLGKSV
jgi:hypothetical protein